MIRLAILIALLAALGSAALAQPITHCRYDGRYFTCLPGWEWRDGREVPTGRWDHRRSPEDWRWQQRRELCERYPERCW